MGQRRSFSRRVTAVAASMGALGGVLAVAAVPAIAGVGHLMVPSVAQHSVIVPAVRVTPNSNLFGCQTGAPHAPRCFGPAQIRTAYDVQRVLDRGVDGTGSTIVLIEAYNQSAAVDDVHAFDAQFGLADPDLQLVAPFGVPPADDTDPYQLYWNQETALDVEWAHAIAPAARLVVVEAASPADVDIAAATAYAVDHDLGDVISQSFGAPETCLDPSFLAGQHATFARAAAKGIALVASAGDNGAAQLSCDASAYVPGVSSPASDPLVLAVGGTTLDADLTTGAYGSESTWNELYTFGLAGGGGYSSVYRRPGYQEHVVARGRGRGVPDVAYTAGIDGGVLVHWGAGAQYHDGNPWFVVGGTSVGAPQWAGLIALAQDAANGRVRGVASSLYESSRGRRAATLFHDITIGDNDYAYMDADGNVVPVAGFVAAPGWDATTGLGTPIGSRIVATLSRGGHGHDDGHHDGHHDDGHRDERSRASAAGQQVFLP